MARFLVTYHGGGMPTDPGQAARARAAFGDWVAASRKAVVDPGAPLRSSTQLANATPEPAITIGGYSILEASSVDEAIAILRSHPFLARGGTLQLHETIAV